MPDDHDPRLDADPETLDASDLADLAFGPAPAPPPNTDQSRWPYTTPSGHTYELPTTAHAVRQRMHDAAQGVAENWDAAELPPPPTWEMLALINQVTFEKRSDIDNNETMKVWLNGQLIFDGVSRDAFLERREHCHHVAVNAPGAEPTCDCALWYSVNPHTGDQVNWVNGPHISELTD